MMPIAIHRKANSGDGRRLEPAKPVTTKQSRPATAPWKKPRIVGLRFAFEPRSRQVR